MNGTTIPTGRDNTYTPAETAPAVKTGRAVFVERDKYDSDDAYKARIDKYESEGFHLVFDTEGSGTSGQSVTPSSGGSSNSGVVHLDYTAREFLMEETGLPQNYMGFEFNYTWQEIFDLLVAGNLVIAKDPEFYEQIFMEPGVADTTWENVLIVCAKLEELEGYVLKTPEGGSVFHFADPDDNFEIFAV